MVSTQYIPASCPGTGATVYMYICLYKYIQLRTELLSIKYTDEMKSDRSSSPSCCSAAPQSSSLSLSTLMTASRADRQIYLPWWQGRKKSSAKPCPASGSDRRGLRGNPCCLAPPPAGHISVCSPWPAQSSATWDQSLSSQQTHRLPHQP